jgi:hypothetical protein
VTTLTRIKDNLVRGRHGKKCSKMGTVRIG